MLDRNSRHINYLRISVTDLCNIRCIYCRPEEGLNLLNRNAILTFEEICAVVEHAVELGIHKFRITGGEPLVRRGIERLVLLISRLNGVKDLAMTTNGILLPEFASKLKESGLARINISLDTLQAEKYETITRGGKLSDVFRGIDEAERAGFRNTKINVVAMNGVNDDEIEAFARLTFDRTIEVRFIELMATRNQKRLEGASFLPVEQIIERIKTLGRLVPLREKSGNGPARRFTIDGAKGSLGFINAVSDPFCADCNRLRLTADGMLRSCLLEGGEIDIKSIIRAKQHAHDSAAHPAVTLSAGQKAALTEAFYDVIDMKPAVHAGSSDKLLMYQVGG